MSDGSLSQDEIDALLQGDSMGFSTPSVSGGSGFTDKQKKDFTGFLSGNIKSVESNLSGMLGENVTIAQPTVEVVEGSAIQNHFKESIVEIKIDFNEGLTGPHSYIFEEKTATVVAGKMMGQDDVDLNEAALSALEEAGNTITGTTITSIGDLLGKTIMNSPGQTAVMSPSELAFSDSLSVLVTYPITVDGLEPTRLFELYGIETAQEIADTFGGGSEPDVLGSVMNGAAMQGGGQQLSNQGMPQMGNQTNVQSVQFPNLIPKMSPAEQGNIGLLMDVFMEMTVELGRTKRLIKDILGMGEGTIIELDKLAGEPVDILVNHKLIAKGEVVVIDENFGVRVTEIVSPMDRVVDLS